MLCRGLHPPEGTAVCRDRRQGTAKDWGDAFRRGRGCICGVKQSSAAANHSCYETQLLPTCVPPCCCHQSALHVRFECERHSAALPSLPPHMSGNVARNPVGTRTPHARLGPHVPVLHQAGQEEQGPRQQLTGFTRHTWLVAGYGIFYEPSSLHPALHPPGAASTA